MATFCFIYLNRAYTPINIALVATDMSINSENKVKAND